MGDFGRGLAEETRRMVVGVLGSLKKPEFMFWVQNFRACLVGVNFMGS
jgi:hypothetical protein